MRKKFILICLLFTIEALACSGHGNQEFSIAVDGADGKVQIEIGTRIGSLGGALVLDRLDMRRPEAERPGFLAMTVKMESNESGDWTFENRRKVFCFSRGSDLPGLPDGVYDLFLNGVYYGQIFLNGGIAFR
jgi:hypothetical protein